ncbi:MAG TPA: DUF1592 domain-containing protein [Planctomycetota bacterium]
MWLALLLPLAGDGLAAGLRPLVEGHCVECHAGAEAKGELDLAGLVGAEEALAERRETLAAIRAVLRGDDMPPPRRPRPPVELVEQALAALEQALGPAAVGPELRRLNRTRYENAVRDLFGVAYPARALFPPDDVGARFDSEAASGGASALLVERWVEAAETIAARALPDESASETRVFAAAELDLEGGAGLRDGRVALFSRGRVGVSVTLPRRSRYRLELVGWGDLAGPERPRIVFDLDRAKLGLRELTREAPAEETLALEFEAEAGAHELGASFVNDFFAPEHEDPGERDRNAHVKALALVGPLDPPPETAFTRALAAELGRGGLDGALAWLGRRVWRRPLLAEERERLRALSDEADGQRTRLRTALVALLASPHFLYEVERPAARGPERAHALATRLAAFLWASVPDEELLDAAARGALARPEERERQVRRMLRDARARALVTEFGAQWLGWRRLEQATPDRRRFPAADAALLDSMRQECEAFLEAMLREERPLAELLTADFAFVDERLARLYGLEGVEGEGVRRVPLPEGTRGGLLGLAALLTVTSNPTRTAPVKRGKWIAETLMGRRVPPPPPGAGVLAEAAATTPATLREELERHRAEPDCAVCHAELDPLGFALEGFDAIGGARRAADVDVRAELPDGTLLDGVDGLRRHLLASDALAPALAEALFVYALGREPEPAERRRLQARVAALPDEQRTFAGLVELVARQPAFLASPVR